MVIVAAATVVVVVGRATVVVVLGAGAVVVARVGRIIAVVKGMVSSRTIGLVGSQTDELGHIFPQEWIWLLWEFHRPHCDDKSYVGVHRYEVHDQPNQDWCHNIDVVHGQHIQGWCHKCNP